MMRPGLSSFRVPAVAAVAFTVLAASTGCATSKGVSNYSSVAVKRPYVIPKGLGRLALGTKLGHARVFRLESTDEQQKLPILDEIAFSLQGSVSERSLGERLSWEVSDGFYIKYQFNDSSRMPVGIRGGLGGFGYGSVSGFVVLGVVGGFIRLPAGEATALELAGTWYPTVGGFMGGSTTTASLSLAWLWQSGERSHWRLFSGLNRKYYTGESPGSTWAIPLGLQHAWRPHDQWELSAGVQLLRQAPRVFQNEQAALLGVTHFYSVE